MCRCQNSGMRRKYWLLVHYWRSLVRGLTAQLKTSYQLISSNCVKIHDGNIKRTISNLFPRNLELECLQCEYLRKMVYAKVDKPGWRWGWGYIYRLGFSSSRPFSLQTSARPWHTGLTARWYPWTWGSSPASDPNIDLMALWSLTTATFLPICAGKVRWIVCNIELKTNLREVLQSRKRPLLVLGPYPGWQRLLALSHLRHNNAK